MIIYLAGPIRPKGDQTLEGNVAIAKSVALELWKMDYTVICPHANSDLPVSLADKEVESSRWLNGDLEIIARCDAIVVLPNWEQSEGTKGEIAFAKERNIPVTYYPDLPIIPLMRQSEIFQHFTDDPITVCPECKQPTLQKVYQVANVHYKGRGWYVKDRYNPDKAV